MGYLDDKRVMELAKEARELGASKQFSNIVDDEGHQYVDLVIGFQGGKSTLALAAQA